MAFSSKRFFFGRRLVRRSFGYHHVEPKKLPHPLGSTTKWRKCYFVHPTSQIPKCDLKSLWLTNTVLEEGLPPEYDASSYVPSDEDDETLHDNIRRAENVSGLLFTLLTSIWARADNPTPLFSHVSMKPSIQSYWRKNGENYIFRGSPDFLIRSALPLTMVTNVPDVKTEARENYQPTNLQLYQRSVDHLRVFPGYRPGSKRSHAHTQILVDQRSSNSNEQLVAHAVLSQFALLSAQTLANRIAEQRNKDKRIEIPPRMETPALCQSIITNGKLFTFSVYQLHTLDLDQVSVWNRVWIRGPMPLIQHSEENAISIKNDCLRLLSAFILRRTKTNV